MTRNRTKLSKFMAYVLRHNPGEVGLELDPEGWVDVRVFLEKVNAKRAEAVSLEDIKAVVDSDAKGRYSLRDGRIRANQGHSIAVQAVDLTPVAPPTRLYHGTTAERWPKIKDSGGLKKMNRHHVHLAADLKTARSVGSRHRKESLLVLEVAAGNMASEGFEFFVSENGVWLTDAVPAKYLKPLVEG